MPNKPPDTIIPDWRSSGFDKNLSRPKDTQDSKFISGEGFDSRLDELPFNRMIQFKNLSQSPQGNDIGKIYWDLTNNTLKIWINSTIGWYDILNRFYGSMYMYTLPTGSGITVTVSVKDTWYRINSGLSSGTLHGFTFANNRELVCPMAGKYLITWSMSFDSNANNEVEGTIMVNNVASTQFASHSEMVSANKPMVVSGSGTLSLAKNDTVSMAVLNTTAANNVLVEHVTCSIVNVGVTL